MRQRSNFNALGLVVVLSALQLLVPAAGPTPGDPTELPPYNTFAPFWMSGEGFRSNVMVNNTVSEERPFTLAVYDSHGRLLTRREHVVPGNDSVTIPIAEEAPGFREGVGYAELTVDREHRGQLPAQMVVLNPQLRVSSALLFAGPGNHRGRIQHAAFWLPQPGSELFLVALNRDDRPVRAEIDLRGARGFRAEERWTIPPGQMRTLQVGLPPAKRGLSGAVEIRTSGGPGSLLLHGFVMNRKTGFSASLEWQDAKFYAEQGFASMQLALSALREHEGVRKQLKPYLLLTNLQSNRVDVQVSLIGGGEAAALNTEPLQPFESRIVDLTEQLPRNEDRPPFGTLDLRWDQAGPVATALWSVAEDWDMVVQSRVLGRAQMKPANSLPFRLGEGWNTQVHLINRLDRPVVFCVFINYDGRFYTYSGAKELQPFQSLLIDVAELRDELVLDEFGRALDPEVSSGQVKVIAHDSDPGAIAVQGLLWNAMSEVSVPLACDYCPPWDREIFLAKYFNYNPAFEQAQYEGVKGTQQRIPTIRLTVDLGKTPVEPQVVTLRPSYTVGSGYHTHDRGDRPNPMIRLPGGSWTASALSVMTATRTFQFDFRPAAGSGNTSRGISGRYAVKLDFLGINDLVTHNVDVGYSLSWLAPGGNFHRRMNDPNHGNGNYHYGHYQTIQMTVNAATRFYEEYGKNQSPAEQMVINDMSITDGGLFDIGGNWNPPHQSHRDGRHVDIPYRVYRNGQDVLVAQNSASWLALRRALVLPGGAARDFDLCEIHNNNHWHCQQGAP